MKLHSIVYLEFDKNKNKIIKIDSVGKTVPIQNKDYIRGYYDVDEIIKKFNPSAKIIKELREKAIFSFTDGYYGFDDRDDKKEIW